MDLEKKRNEKLTSYVNSLLPIIYINHFDFEVSADMISKVKMGHEIYEYDTGIGVVDFKTRSIQHEVESLSDFLDNYMELGYEQPTYLVLKDVHNELKDPSVISYLKHIASRNLYTDGYELTVFIVSGQLVIPRELENLITVFDMPMPDSKIIRDIISNYALENELSISNNTLDELTLSLRGMNEFQIRQCLNIAFQQSGTLSVRDKVLFLQQKEQLIKKSGLLEMIPVKEEIEDIGGLVNLKKWLEKKKKIFDNLSKAIRYGVDTPKGIMLVGMPGCGKSLAAKATAKLFDMPLVRLDIGRLLGKYVGESETNMRKALKLAEATSPCVLWIDEIEKAFAGIGSDNSEVTTRLFGQFLTWMQEKDNEVFIVATANDITRLPPEFLRKGRFDELFFVDFPNADERELILQIHLRKRNQERSIDLTKIVEKTEGYNGADLEAIVKVAVENCFIEGKAFVTEKDLLKAQRKIKSISVTLKDKIDLMRKATEKIDLVNASSASVQSEDRNKKLQTKKLSPIGKLVKHDIHLKKASRTTKTDFSNKVNFDKSNFDKMPEWDSVSREWRY